MYTNPPPLPPRAIYQPLQRVPSLFPRPLKIPGRYGSKISTPLHPEDCFGFEIVDVDEATNLKVSKI